MAEAIAPAPGLKSRGFLGHPPGLAYLAFTEAWERFSFYGMQALLVLYMIGQLLKPGHVEHVAGFGALRAAIEHATGSLSIQALASQIFGLYAASVYLTPIVGGFLGDRVLGRTRAITLGAALMALGHFLMAFEASFVGALALLIVGAGFVKGNIASQVGSLYEEHDTLRRADAFQIFTLAVNAGVIASPLVCGTLGEKFGWQYGFGAAGVGMLIGLGIYLAGRKSLPPDRPRGRDATQAAPLTRKDWLAIVALLALLPILAVVFVGNNQIYNAYVVWARDNADLLIFGWRMPVTWLLSFDAAVSAAMLAGAVFFWHWMAAREIVPHELTKLALGGTVSILGFLILALGAFLETRTGSKVPLGFLIAFHIVNTIGFVNILPVAMSLFARTAPRQVNATMIGIFYLLFFGANLMVGSVGARYETMSHTDFWLLHAGLCAASTLVLLVLYRPLKSVLA